MAWDVLSPGDRNPKVCVCAWQCPSLPCLCEASRPRPLGQDCTYADQMWEEQGSGRLAYTSPEGQQLYTDFKDWKQKELKLKFS